MPSHPYQSNAVPDRTAGAVPVEPAGRSVPGPAREPGTPAAGPFGAPALRADRQARTAPAGHMIVCGDDA
ncbi:hypothetical protein, partial [Streptomyces sp. NK15101]|uniref:hypothetical protein n=1 Tax=Streptomyces sp. NK15101 TaxID=2873261 RepID=UPI001CED1DD7